MKSTSEVLMSFRMIAKLYELCLEDVREKYNLSKIEIKIINFLHNNPDKDSIREISEMRMLSKGNVSRGVDSLIQRGFVERTPDENDRRGAHLRLKPEASPIIEEIQQAGTVFLKKAFSDFSDEEFQLYRSLNKRMMQTIAKHLERGSNYGK